MKKQNPKMLREQKKKEKRARYEALQQKRKKLEDENTKKSINKHIKEKKSAATSKARKAGVKSTLFYKNKVIMTTYADHTTDNTILEKEIVNFEINDKTAPEHYIAEIVGKKIKTKSSNCVAMIDNPSYQQIPGRDEINAKEKLEQRYFGKTFDDNIHIQIAYNIIDIEKILAKYVNSIVFELNNIANPKSEMDFVGNLITTENYSKFKCNECKYKIFTDNYVNNPNLNYFSSIFFKTENYENYSEMSEFQKGRKCEQSEQTIRSEKEIYNILTFVSQWRQFLMHPEITEKMYSVDQWMSSVQSSIVSEIYDREIEKYCNDFIGKNRNLIAAITSALNVKNKKEAIQLGKRFFDFAANKKYKEIGIAIKKIRDCLPQKQSNLNINEKTRSDFLIYNFLEDHKKEKNELVEYLRSESCNEEKKNQIYLKFCKDNIEGKIGSINETDLYSKYENFRNIIESQIENCLAEKRIFCNKLSKFFKALFVFSLFLGKKERNEMWADIRYRIESIAGFVKILKNYGESDVFKPEYNIYESENFLESGRTMQWVLVSIDDELYGLTPKQFVLSVNFEGKIPHISNDIKNRRFFKNQVMQQWRFIYLMRYTNPNIIYNITHTRSLIKLVLNKEDLESIDSKCRLFNDYKYQINKKEKIAFLTDKIVNFDFEKDILSEVKRFYEEENRTKACIKEKEILKDKIDLYFLVPYKIIRNLMIVNYRYFVALYAAERDSKLFFPEETVKDNRRDKMHFCKMVEYSDAKMKHLAEKNPKLILDERAIRLFRNCVAHVNVLQMFNNTNLLKEMKKINTKMFSENSEKESNPNYFKLYHYFLQYMLLNSYRKKSKCLCCENTQKLLVESAKHNHAYSRDLLKMLCYPFAYNTARYRNLTEEKLFETDEHLNYGQMKVAEISLHI